MRKLLVLVAILAMSSMASAMTVSLIDTGTAINVNVAGATYDPYLGLVIQAPGTLSNFAAGADAPSVASSFGPITVDGAGEVWGFGVASGEPYNDGVWLTADWAAGSAVDVIAYETFDGGGSWQELARITVPEPMTIALLGLGSLFMLRRRK